MISFTDESSRVHDSHFSSDALKAAARGGIGEMV
jgi:hypothetical protein